MDPVVFDRVERHLDMFAYARRDIEVRLFEVNILVEGNDLGVKGDVNLDRTVNVPDAAVVLNATNP